MSKVSESILRGAKEALAYAHNNKKGAKTHRIAVPKTIDVKEIRKGLHMSRKKFADEFAFSVRTLEKWERGERQPEGPARAYLQVIANNPNMVRKTLSQASTK